MQTAYITHPEFLKHDMGIGHPECPARIQAIQDQLIASGLFDFLKHYEAQKASKEELALVHTQEYIEWVFSQS
ncbi:MAG: histone deacetylase family protein, partial [Methylotenera sp.]|nr:histone deacetylase family protein [Methylotenera sp.]